MIIKNFLDLKILDSSIEDVKVLDFDLSQGIIDYQSGCFVSVIYLRSQVS